MCVSFECVLINWARPQLSQLRLSRSRVSEGNGKQRLHSPCVLHGAQLRLLRAPQPGLVSKCRYTSQLCSGQGLRALKSRTKVGGKGHESKGKGGF